MLKNLFLLGLLTWVSMTYAKTTVAHETMSEAESFKVETGKHEQEPTRARSVAGGKIKKQKPDSQKEAREPSETDSEVRYWQYSE